MQVTMQQWPECRAEQRLWHWLHISTAAAAGNTPLMYNWHNGFSSWHQWQCVCEQIRTLAGRKAMAKSRRKWCKGCVKDSTKM